MGVAEGRYREAGGALEEYAGALDRAQSDSLNALAAAKPAQADAMEARTRAERDIAAERAIEIINGACGDGLADSWWDDWGRAITQWIAKICEIVSGIAGVLALLVSWVPIVGQALAAFLGALSAVTGVIAALTNTVLAMAGEQTWLDAVISVGFAALGCVGLGGLRGVAASARAMAGARGAWAAAGVPKDEKRPTPQPDAGTDRQARGHIMKALRTAHFEGTDGLTKRKVLDAARIDGGDRYQPTRVYRALLKEGMIVYNEDTKRVTLPR